MDARGLDAELAPVAGLGQRDVAHVVFDVEVRVVDPIRPVDVEGHALQAAAEHGVAREPVVDVRQQGLEAQRPVAHRALVVDVDK